MSSCLFFSFLLLWLLVSFPMWHCPVFFPYAVALSIYLCLILSLAVSPILPLSLEDVLQWQVFLFMYCHFDYIGSRIPPFGTVYIGGVMGFPGHT